MKLKLLTGMSYFFIVALIPFLIISETLIGNAVYLSMGLIGLATFELLYIRHKDIELVYSKSELISAVILSAFLIIMISIFDILNSGFLDGDVLIRVYPLKLAHVILVWGYMVYLPSVFVAAFVCVWCAMRVVLENKMMRGGV